MEDHEGLCDPGDRRHDHRDAGGHDDEDRGDHGGQGCVEEEALAEWCRAENLHDVRVAWGTLYPLMYFPILRR